MAIARRFLGWHKPAVALAAEALHDLGGTAPGGFACDLSRCLVVTPTARAGRRVTAALAGLLEGRALCPPTFTTPGRLPDALGCRIEGLAPCPPSVALLAWADALDQLNAQQRQALAMPEAASMRQRLSLARELTQLAEELAAEGVSIEGLAQLRGRDAFDAAAVVERHARRRMRTAGLIDPAEARCALVHNPPASTHAYERVIALGVAEWPGFTSAMLESASQNTPVELWVTAPESEAGALDDWGQPIAEVWRDRRLQIDDAQLQWADEPDDVAQRASEALAEACPPGLSPSDASVVLADPALAPPVQRRLGARGLRSHRASGEPADRSRPARLLDAAGRYLASRSFDDLAELVRHPDLGLAQADADPAHAWPGLSDAYAARHVPQRVPAETLPGNEGQRLARIARAIDGLLPSEPDRTLPWRTRLHEIAGLLERVYGQAQLDPRTREALDAIGELLVEAAQHGSRETPRSAPDVLAWLTASLGSRTVATDPFDPAVELIGPVDAVWDDASSMALVGLHEGALPSGGHGSGWLTDADRAAIGLTTSDQRYAVEAFRLTAVLQAHPGLVLVGGRRNAEGDPLRPSRFALADDAGVVARRLRRFYDESPRASAPLFATRPEAPAIALGPPRPEPGEQRADRDPLDPLPVTAFKRYLACPYRFYLERVLGLRTANDPDLQLDPMGFGSLAHDVLARFAHHPAAQDANEPAVRKTLRGLLDDLASARFGHDVEPAVTLQIERLRVRLGAFAGWQASSVREGWRVAPELAELEHEPTGLEIGQGLAPVRLTGRIDRVDRHDDGRLRVIDYKTAAAAEDPRKAHRVSGAWIDLQLPLYRYLAEQRGWGERIQVGYVCLPKALADTGWKPAVWPGSREKVSHEALHAEALDKAREVARAMRRGVFWPPGGLPRYADGFELLGADAWSRREEWAAEAGAAQ